MEQKNGTNTGAGRMAQDPKEYEETLEMQGAKEAAPESHAASQELSDASESPASEQGYRQKMAWNRNYLQLGLIVFLVAVGVLLFYYLLFHTESLMKNYQKFVHILNPVFVGLIIAYLLTPILNTIETNLLKPLFYKTLKIKKTTAARHWMRAVSVVITAATALLVVYGVIRMLLSTIVPSVTNIVMNFDTYTNNFIAWISSITIDNPDLGEYFTSLVDRYSEDAIEWVDTNVLDKTSSLLRSLSLSIISFFKSVWNFIIGFIISIYVLSSKEAFVARSKKLTYALYPREKANRIVEAMRYTHKTFIGFISGKVLDSIIIGLICFIATTLMQTPYAALVSLIIGITNIIPFFGPYLGAIPTTLLIFMVDPMHPQAALSFALFIIILQQVDGNIIGPKILGESTGLSGFWVIFSITLFGGLFGIFGMIIGVPVFAIIYNGIKSFTVERLKKKQQPTDTADYINFARMGEDLKGEPLFDADTGRLLKEEPKRQEIKLFKRSQKNEKQDGR